MREGAMQWFKTDYTTPAGAFDVTVLGQDVK
jgi:hypothetical protein